MFSTRYMYYYHISILRMGTYLYTIVNTALIVLYFKWHSNFVQRMPCDFTILYVICYRFFLLSKCLGCFRRDLNKKDYKEDHEVTKCEKVG